MITPANQSHVFFVRGYLRASTDEQDANRARSVLERFAEERGFIVCNFYVENVSGAKLEREELFRLINDSRTNDVLLVEDVDRLTRLTGPDWESLKIKIKEKGIRVVAVNVPTTWQHLSAVQNDFDMRIFTAINDMLMDMLAAIARRDYEVRRVRQAQGIKKAKELGLMKGKGINKERYEEIYGLLSSGLSWNTIVKRAGCSRGTISRVKNYYLKLVNEPVSMRAKKK